MMDYQHVGVASTFSPTFGEVLAEAAQALRRPCLTSRPTLLDYRHGNARFRFQTPGQRPGGRKAISYELSFETPASHSTGS